MTEWVPVAWRTLGIKGLCNVVTKSFFKDRNLIGSQRVPAYGPIIYFGNHSNQFVDAAVFIASLPRYPRFLIAESSLHMPIIGELAKAAGAIPVMRAGVQNFNGLGAAKIIDESEIAVEGDEITYTYTIEGDGSAFATDNIKPRDCLIFSEGKGSTQYRLEVVEVHTSLERLKCTSAIRVPQELRMTPRPYVIQPKLDQTKAYSAVTNTLASGSSIGIFPEGGSHDRKDLLPLKPGIAVMALTAASQGIKNIMLIPCGIQYSNPGKVMSDYTVEINRPIIICDDLVEEYRKDKRAAVAKLMDQVRSRLEEVVVTASDPEEYECLELARCLYPPEGHVCRSQEVYTELTHLLVRILQSARGTTELQSLNQALLRYRDVLNQYSFSDEDVHHLRKNSTRAIIHLGELMPSFIYSLSIAVLTGFLWIPARLISSFYADWKRNAALRKSTVKIRGSDVVASHKLILLIVFLPAIMTLTSIVTSLYLHGWSFFQLLWNVFIGVFLIQPSMYYYGVMQADMLSNKFGSVMALSHVITGNLVIWRRDTKSLLSARGAAVLKLRATLDHLLSDENNDAQIQKCRERLEFIFPREIITADSDRISQLLERRSAYPIADVEFSGGFEGIFEGADELL